MRFTNCPKTEEIAVVSSNTRPQHQASEAPLTIVQLPCDSAFSLRAAVLISPLPVKASDNTCSRNHVPEDLGAHEAPLPSKICFCFFSCFPYEIRIREIEARSLSKTSCKYLEKSCVLSLPSWSSHTPLTVPQSSNPESERQCVCPLAFFPICLIRTWRHPCFSSFAGSSGQVAVDLWMQQTESV